MSYLDEMFKTTNTDKLKNSCSKNVSFEIVNGSDMYKGYYNESIVETKFIKFFQLSLFNDINKKRAVRIYNLKGVSSKGACFFDYKILNITNYKISEDKLNIFIKILDKKIKLNNQNLKFKYKYYPVYNFDYTSPPSGNEINECISELLN